MSTETAEKQTQAAAPTTPSAGYSLGRPQGKCSGCGREIAAGEKFTAAVRETAIGLERLDIGTECLGNFEKPTLLAYWQGTQPAAAAVKPRVFVDDTVLCELFERLGESSGGNEPAKLSFRFVLGLILMRKRLLAYDSTQLKGAEEFWIVRLKGREQAIELLNPRLEEEQIAQVSLQLGQILSGEPA